MNKLKAIGAEIAGMFVDDWRLAATVLAWVLLVRFALASGALSPYLFVAGLAAILLWFTKAA